MDFRTLYRRFSYLNFLYIFLVLHIKFHDDPIEYRAILKAWERIAVRSARPMIKLGKFRLELPFDPAILHDAYASIEHSRDFFENLRSIEVSKPHYADREDLKAVEIADGYITIIPPVTENSGSPANILARMAKPAGTNALSFMIWTMQPERDKTICILAAIDRSGVAQSGVASDVTMDPATWYSLMTLDLTAFDPMAEIELTLQVDGVGPLPFYCTGVRLSHFQFH